MRLAIAACAIALAIFAGDFRIPDRQQAADGGRRAGRRASGAGTRREPAAPGRRKRCAPSLKSLRSRYPLLPLSRLLPSPLPLSRVRRPSRSATLPPSSSLRPLCAGCAAAEGAAGTAASQSGRAQTCANPNALGVARTVEIDTTGGPGFGFEHFRQHDFLEPGEVVLTYDDGPWPQRTMAVLNALAAHCTRRSSSRSASTPPTSRTSSSRSPPRGHSIGSHTWCHQNLAAKPVAGRQERNREGHQRGGVGGRRTDRAVLPLPGAEAPAGTGQLSRRAQHRDLLDRHGLVRLQDAQARAGPSIR